MASTNSKVLHLLGTPLGHPNLTLRRLISFVLMHGVGSLGSIGLLFALVELFQMHYMVAAVLSGAAGLLVKFVLVSLFTYEEKKSLMTVAESANRGRIADAAISTTLFAIALVYYYTLSSKIWSWLYVSGDSGDWLLFTNEWVVPQPFGSPLFISVIRLLGLVFPRADAYQLLTLFLSVLPGALLVVLTYFIGFKLTGKRGMGLVSSVSLLGMSVFLTQATVLEQYMFTALFIAGAYLAYLHNRLTWAVVLLGIGTASHIIVGVIALLWLAIEQQQRRRLFKLIPLYVVFGILPYGLILYLLATSESLFYMGGLTWAGLNVYLGNVYHTGNLSLAVVPQRLLDTAIVLLGMLGLAALPLVIGLKERVPRDNIALAVIGCMAWFWFSNSFFSTFKYMAMACPFIAAYIAVGLNRLPKWHIPIILASTLALTGANAFYLNANALTMKDPQATEFYTALLNLPDGTAILSPRGGAYGFAFFYAVSEGKGLTPLLLTKATPTGIADQVQIDFVYASYASWFRDKYGYVGKDCIMLAREALAKDREVYYVSPLDYNSSSIDAQGWALAFDFESTDMPGITRVTGVKLPDWESFLDKVEETRNAREQ